MQIKYKNKSIITGITAGTVVAQIMSLEELLGTREHWHLALSAYVILVIVCFLPYTWLPESPKYLYIVAGKRDEARKGELATRFLLYKCATLISILQQLF